MPSAASLPRATIAAAGLGGTATLIRALLEVRRDGWIAAGLPGVAWNALRRHLEGSAPLLAVLVTAALGLIGAGVARRIAEPHRWRLELAARAVLVVAAFLIATGHLIAPSAATPGLRSASGLAGNAAVAVAVAAAAWLSWLAARRAIGLALAAAAAPLVLGATAGPAEPRLDGSRTSVVVFSLDTLRADRMGCYGSPRDATPHLDAFAREAIRFEQAATPFPFTLTAHASLLTGLDPAAHGAIPTGRRVEDRLPLYQGVPTLAAALREAGLATVAVVDDCLWMQPQYGLGRGFHLWRVVGGDASAKARAVEEILRDLDGRPCFLFFHCFDVHSDYERLPYDCDPEDRGRYSGWYRGPFDGSDPARPAVRASDLLREWNNTDADVPDEVVRFVSDLYDEGVRSTDRAVGALLARLDRSGFREHAAVLVTADHGEEFREHGRFMHDVQLYEESVRVPLLLRLPGGARAGEVVAAPVSLTDVAPTLAVIAGVALEDVQGRVVLDVARGSDAGASLEDAPIFFGGEPGTDGVRLGRFKLIRRGERAELYDLAADPLERHDLAAERPDVVRSLTAVLETRLEQSAAAAATRSRGAIAISEAERHRMGALGYR